MSTNNQMRFTAVVDFEIDCDEAAGILSEPTELASRSLQNWFVEHGTAEQEYLGTYNLTKLKEGLGEHLASRKIEEKRLLAAPSPEAKEVA